MKNKKLFKRVLALAILMVMLGTNIVNAALFDSSKLDFNFKFDFNSIFNKKDDTNTDITIKQDNEEYKEFLNDFYTYVKGINISKDKETIVLDLFQKLEDLKSDYNNNEEITNEATMLQYQLAVMSETGGKTSILDTLKTTLKSLIDKIGGGSSEEKFYAYKLDKYIYAKTAKDNIKLHANIYYAEVDANNNPTSNKWALLVHPFMLNGSAMADTIGEMYTSHGYNVIAPDLRGFGDSEGDEAMGYLEALDMWDWLTELNKDYDVDSVIVHGISLGGATTIQLSGLEVDGHDITYQNVDGIVEDCGFTSMVEMVEKYMGSDSGLLGKLADLLGKDNEPSENSSAKDYLINDAGVLGQTGADFDTIENGLNSLEKCKVPVLIIHGTKDSMVPYENSDRVYATVTAADSEVPYVLRYTAEGKQHAFILLGSNEATYKSYVDKFIEKVEEIVKLDGDHSNIDKEEAYTPNVTEETSITKTISKVLRLLKGMLGK